MRRFIDNWLLIISIVVMVVAVGHVLLATVQETNKQRKVELSQKVSGYRVLVFRGREDAAAEANEWLERHSEAEVVDLAHSETNISTGTLFLVVRPKSN